jgi:colanic acid biosynthesis glycosyl transferase WcaI
MKLDAAICRSATRIIAISDPFRCAILERGVPPERVAVIPNWITDEGELHWDEAAARQFRGEHGVSERTFLLVYAGNVGVASGILEIAGVLRRRADHDGVVLLVAGSGSDLAAVNALAEDGEGMRIVIHSPWRPGETAPTLLSADVLLLPTAGKQSLYSVPSKLMYYMLSGRPILAVAEAGSEAARTLNDAGCGWSVPPNDEGALVSTLEKITALDSCTRMAMGVAGRTYASDHFAQKMNLPRIITLLETTVLPQSGEHADAGNHRPVDA